MSSNTIAFFFLLALLSTSSIAFGQKDFIHTKKFQKKIDQLGLFYYHPTEAWLHPVKPRSDDYGPFDLVLESSDEDIEIMYRFKEINDKSNLASHPQLDMYQYVANLASNGQHTNITLTEIEQTVLDTVFNAHWGLYADFKPKESLTTLPYCRMLAIYKEEHALIYSMIFYEEEVPQYFTLPISFK